MKFTYKDFKDKTSQGITKEINDGLIKIAIYFYQTEGLPVDIFKEEVEKLTTIKKIILYMNFRNKHLELFK